MFRCAKVAPMPGPDAVEELEANGVARGDLVAVVVAPIGVALATARGTIRVH